jgi:hypothetical protein
VGCGTVTLYDQEAKRLQTVRYARMPESKKGHGSSRRLGIFTIE